MKKLVATLILSILLLGQSTMAFAQDEDTFTDHEWDTIEALEDDDLTDEEWEWLDSYENGYLTDEEDLEFEIWMKEKIAELEGEDEEEIVEVEEVTTPAVVAQPVVAEESWFKRTFMQWEFVAIVVTILSGIAAITGFSISSRKKRKSISKYMTEIDNTFSEYKQKTKRCEAELYRLRDLLEERLKKGKIDESTYELLQKRVDKYLGEISN
ncbi:hypothetical protein ACFL2V_04400 [Pseudomonadota bacterium]